MSRKIVTFNNVSADGYFTTVDDKLDWVVDDPEVTAVAMDAAPHVDAMLFGRKTFQMFEAGWRDKAADPHSGEVTDASRSMSQWINEKRKIVFSRSLKDVTWHNSRLVHELDKAAVDKIKRDVSGDIIVFGSGTVASRLTDLGLIDEYTFIVNPVFLGSGRTLIDDIKRRVSLKLVQERGFPASGNVVLRYARV